MRENYFLMMLKGLFEEEGIVLYNNLLDIHAEDLEEAKSYLQRVFEKESINYPINSPVFHPNAALWSAKVIYTCSQLLLYREHKEADLALLIVDFDEEIVPSAFISADLCLRFLPDLLQELKFIDSSDQLIAIIENLLCVWHYSSIPCKFEVSKLKELHKIEMNPGLLQLFVDRIIAYKNLYLAFHPVFEEHVKAVLGLYPDVFWKDFTEEMKLNEQ